MADLSKIEIPGDNIEYNIKDAVSRDNIKNIENIYGSKNLALNYDNRPPKVISSSGITFNFKEDGSVEVNGTATSSVEAAYSYRLSTFKRNRIPAGTYNLRGCPAGGGPNKYALFLDINKEDESIDRVGIDYGDGAEFTLNKEEVIQIIIHVEKDQVCDNLVFWPSVVLKSLDDGVFNKAAMNNYALTNQKLDKSISEGINSNNLLQVNVGKMTEFQDDGTWFGLTVTQNLDGSITFNGTTIGDPSATSRWLLIDTLINGLQPGLYKLSGVRPGTNSANDNWDKVCLLIRTDPIDGVLNCECRNDEYNGQCRITNNIKNKKLVAFVGVRESPEGKTYDNITVYPKLELITPAEEYPDGNFFGRNISNWRLSQYAPISGETSGFKKIEIQALSPENAPGSRGKALVIGDKFVLLAIRNSSEMSYRTIYKTGDIELNIVNDNIKNTITIEQILTASSSNEFMYITLLPLGGAWNWKGIKLS